MDSAGEPACWSHLLCERCGGIHGADERCQSEGAATISLVQAPAIGSRGTASAELNATVIVLTAGATVDRARIDRDVALTIISGSGTLSVWREGVPTSPVELPLAPGLVVLLHADDHRAMRADAAGLAWSSVHRARAPLNPTRD